MFVSEKVGKRILYYQNGMIMETIPYENGRVHGTKSRYFDTGLLEEESEYQRDVLNGFVTRYNADGSVAYKQEYKKGFPVEKREEIVEKKQRKLEEEPKQEMLTPEELDRLL